MPYSGALSVDPRPLYPAQHFVVMVPKTMQFAAPGTDFQSMDDPQQSSATVEVASNTKIGQKVSFKISGTGLLPEGGSGGQDTAGGGGQAVGGAQVSGPESRPGGGLGPPIDAPDPLDKYRWYILGAMAIVLAAGAIYISGRSKRVPGADFADADLELPSLPVASKPVGRSALLMEALKEELFQLELDHKQGRISQPEYDKAKAALDQTLERALKRETQKA